MPQHTEADVKAEIDRILSEVDHHALAIGDAVHRVLRESMLRGWDPDVVEGKLAPFARTVARLAGQARLTENTGPGWQAKCGKCGYLLHGRVSCLYCMGHAHGMEAKSLENKNMLESAGDGLPLRTICRNCGSTWIKTNDKSACLYCMGYDAGTHDKSRAIILENKNMLEALALLKRVREDVREATKGRDREFTGPWMKIVDMLGPATKEALKQLIVKIDQLP